MAELQLFCDGSADPTTGIGYGACLLISSDQTSLEDMISQIRVKPFAQTTAARLEMQTLLWALQEFVPPGAQLTIHCDSQTICELPQRRRSLEEKHFCSRLGRPLNNADLYREFFEQLDNYQLEFCKRCGHLPAAQRTLPDQIFRLVDKAARRALRDELKIK